MFLMLSKVQHMNPYVSVAKGFQIDNSKTTSVLHKQITDLSCSSRPDILIPPHGAETHHCGLPSCFQAVFNYIPG